MENALVALKPNSRSPGVLNSLNGAVTVLVGAYASHNGEWSVTAKITMSIVIFSLSYMSVACATYQLWFLQRVD